MSKLRTVRTALETNPDVVIVHVSDEKNFQNLPENPKRWESRLFTHLVEFFVASRQGLYTADELQTFMEGLVPGLEPKAYNKPYQTDKILYFGKLFYDEIIWEERIARKITITDPDLQGLEGVVNGKRTIIEDRNFSRRILVRPFPDEKLARDILSGIIDTDCGNVYAENGGVYLKVLRHYQPRQQVGS